MMKHLADRKFKLIRNAVIIVLALLLVWLLLGVPALTKTQAFRRAMREHFLVPKDPKVFFGTDGSLSALAEVGGVYVQTCLGKWIGWQHSNWSETEAVDGVYIVPLFAQGQKIECPEVAVLAEGERAKLIFTDYNGQTQLLNSLGKQDGWFLFRFVRDDQYRSGISVIDTGLFMYLDTPVGEKDCSFVFVSYDAEGRELIRVEKMY